MTKSRIQIITGQLDELDIILRMGFNEVNQNSSKVN